jgi:RNA polymerase sigma-70 factor (ECF subfamily)
VTVVRTFVPFVFLPFPRSAEKFPEFCDTFRRLLANPFCTFSILPCESFLPDAFDERAVACGLQRGDREAWTLLYQHHSERVWRYVARLVGPDKTAVSDIVQETFLSAARSARTYDATRGTLAQWLSGIAHRQSALHWRRQSRSTLFAEGVVPSDWSALWSSEDADPCALMERRETAAAVRCVLTEMDAEAASLLTGKYLDGLSIEDLVRTYGGTTEGVRSKLARARREFKTLFEKQAASGWHALEALRKGVAESVASSTAQPQSTTPFEDSGRATQPSSVPRP